MSMRNDVYEFIPFGYKTALDHAVCAYEAHAWHKTFSTQDQAHKIVNDLNLISHKSWSVIETPCEHGVRYMIVSH